MKNAIITTHNLSFETAPGNYADWYQQFRIGTCEGQWGSVKGAYFILSVFNKTIGNGHLNDVFEWFEFGCKRDNKNLLVLECMNERFYEHLVNKRGFLPLDTGKENVIKVYNRKAHKHLLKHGNELLYSDLKCK